MENALQRQKPAVLVIMLHGFDRALLSHAPNMKRLVEGGFSGDVLPTFPYENEPIAHSFATGLDPSVHGLVANHFYDHKEGEMFYKKEKFYTFAGRAKPLYAYDGSRSFCFDWHGSQFTYHGQTCRQADTVIYIQKALLNLWRF